MNQLEYVKLETNSQPNAAVIWLHGLGADGHDLASIVPGLDLPASYAIRCIFPHAPRRSVTINGGMSMRAWYDILDIELERKVDMDNVQTSVNQVQKLIEEQITLGIPSERIVLAGFSQGGVIAYQTGLLGKYKLAGIMALSAYLADPAIILDAEHSVNAKTPILIHHGLQDPIVPHAMSINARNCLQQKGYQISSQDYTMPHAICPEQIKHISTWLQARLA